MRTISKRAVLAAAVASALTLSVGGVTAHGDDRHASGGDDRFTLRLIEIEGAAEFVDLGAPGESSGDHAVVESRLFARSGEPAGRASTVCTRIRAARFHCTGTLRLETGTLQLANTIALGTDQPVRFAILGGTGRFRDAYGQGTGSPTATPGRFRLVVQGGHVG